MNSVTGYCFEKSCPAAIERVSAVVPLSGKNNEFRITHAGDKPENFMRERGSRISSQDDSGNPVFVDGSPVEGAHRCRGKGFHEAISP